ncbi:ABC transporter permease [Ligilactobacillus apodemi]|uniref:MacB-like periplasmic core domain-containing protein n=1 Tax=Ligilactobacillus apodemi DSM 16634 = JCM 16172 TaxID=1423724 RepID=A0A0R1TR44_9LACO|nr:ABC transporter permease [Ligilactobacillus apodemi]KRL83926.1 hypothetical protein FC32_GL001194 [Ligilactobacillus apodemi DSM 16634 = JCM 16172]
MFKRKIAVVFYVILISFFCVYLFFKIQERDLIMQLNNNNLSFDAYVVTLKENTSLADFNKKVKESSLTDIQIHYQDKKDKITYFYGKGDYTTPPLLSGHFFASSDFESDVPLAIVGKKYKNKLYIPKDQSYLKINGSYVPVIGVMGDSYTSDLDSQIFIAASVKTLAKLQTNNFKIVIDMTSPVSASTLKKKLGLATAINLVKKDFIISNKSWINSHWTQLAGLLVAAVGILAQMAVWLVSAKRRYIEAVFLQTNKAKFIFEEWRTYSIWVGLGMILGSMLGMFIFQLTSYTYLLAFMGSLYVGSIILFYLLISLRLRKE